MVLLTHHISESYVMKYISYLFLRLIRGFRMSSLDLSNIYHFGTFSKQL
ncbi:hypothetical protein F383_13992 [Gossypium arboreum]|uniref:Uncharacterized protein n=1 Tax=Gossypium arboreum TaxID=29729 RepID=A0A0B0NA04_GOSAR|nr:hypothetical protein F383_13992 [Gossypium arboreum]